jgi:glycerol uptake facilitator-like aquaporin
MSLTKKAVADRNSGNPSFRESGAQQRSGYFCGQLQQLWRFWVTPLSGGILGGGAWQALMEE